MGTCLTKTQVKLLKSIREQNLKQATSETLKPEVSKGKDLFQRYSYKQPTVLQPLRKLAEEPPMTLFMIYLNTTCQEKCRLFHLSLSDFVFNISGLMTNFQLVLFLFLSFSPCPTSDQDHGNCHYLVGRDPQDLSQG